MSVSFCVNNPMYCHLNDRASSGKNRESKWNCGGQSRPLHVSTAHLFSLWVDCSGFNTQTHTRQKKPKNIAVGPRLATSASISCSVWPCGIFSVSLIFIFSKAEPSRANMAAAEQRVQEAAPAATHCFWQERWAFGCGWSMRELTSRSAPTVSLSLHILLLLFLSSL